MSFHAVVIFGLGKDLLFKSGTPLLLIQSRIFIRKTSSLLSQSCPTIQIRKMRTRHAIWTILLQQSPRNIWGHMSQLILADTLTLIINEKRIKKVIKIFTWFYILLNLYKTFLKKKLKAEL